jgi:hypothetical protein
MGPRKARLFGSLRDGAAKVVHQGDRVALAAGDV